jgi:outer membrane protein OmpA-like peptidoglycan-associated protein
MRILMMLCVAACCAVPARAQDVEGSKDHPMVSRFPGYVISNYDVSDFGSHDFDMPDGTTKTVEGRYWGISYGLAEGKKKGGPLEISRNYLKTFTDRGGSKVVENVHADGGTMVAKMPVAGKTIWLQTDIANGGEMYTLFIVEEAAMEQKVDFTAMELAKALNATGSVALHNILFDTGKATIKAESAAALTPIAELLKSDPALKLEIQGHTDNVGAAAANLKLSQDRAAAVKAYLVQNLKADGARLTTAGFGDTKPVADNKTEEGRGQNRRVELAKK